MKNTISNLMVKYEYAKLKEIINWIEPYCVNSIYEKGIFTFNLKTGYMVKFSCNDNDLLKQQVDYFDFLKPYIDDKLLQDILYYIYDLTDILGMFLMYKKYYYNFIITMDKNTQQQLLEVLKWVSGLNHRTTLMEYFIKFDIIVNSQIRFIVELPIDNVEELQESITYIDLLKPQIDKLFFMEKMK